MYQVFLTIIIIWIKEQVLNFIEQVAEESSSIRCWLQPVLRDSHHFVSVEGARMTR
jgi:hypothetical protein